MIYREKNGLRGKVPLDFLKSPCPKVLRTYIMVFEKQCFFVLQAKKMA
jgi:hypothetical protein